MSVKSAWSYSGGIGSNVHGSMPMWFGPDYQSVGGAPSRTDQTMSDSPATSIFDGDEGGLSPRPQSQARAS